MEENIINKNKKRYLLIGIIVTIIMLGLGITLAVTDWTKLFVISGTSGCFTINYTKGQDVTGSIEAGTSYQDKGVSTDIVMYKDPNCKVDALGTLYLTTNDTSTIDFTSKALKYSVVVNNTEVASGAVKGIANQVIYRFYLNNTETTYKVYLWLDSSLYIEKQDDNYSGFVHAEAVQVTEKYEIPNHDPIDNSGANYPVLVKGLIPVVYNETTAKWVKADTESSTSTYGWYDYTQKKWANAVLVSETGTRYTTTDKTVNISNNTTSDPGYISNNKGVDSSTATSTFTITTGSTAGTLSFDYSVSSESRYDKLTITVNGTTIANAISGEVSDTYSVSATTNTTYTIVATYTKDSSTNKGTDTAVITNLSYPTGSTITVTNGDTYYFAEGTLITNHNQMGAGFAYENNKFVLQDVTSGTAISSGIVGKYICPNITQTECTTVYKISEASSNITKVTEYTDVSTVNEVRTTYQNAEAGTEITDSDILAFYVWIPRYKYKVWNKDKVVGTQSYNAQTTGIDIVFEDGTSTTGTISCVYSFAAPSSTAGSPNETCTGSNGDYYTHPAFNFGDNQIKGFWIGKYELSSETPTATDGGGNSTTLTPRILPNVRSWRTNKLSNFSTVIQNMQVSSNIYGLSTDKSITDSHMLTNMEWGAVAYLTNSNYGRCSGGSCTEVTINNCSTRITGIGADTVDAGYSSTTCTTEANKYNGEKGVLASTTGNVYGVYDMSGGADEYVMGNVSSTADAYTFYSYEAGFTSSWYNDYSNQKYVNTYANGTTYRDQSAYNRGRLGDATGEVAAVSNDYGGYGWYSDRASFPYSSHPWFIRGCDCNCRSSAGVLGFDQDNGWDSSDNSARAALVWFVF